MKKPTDKVVLQRGFLAPAYCKLLLERLSYCRTTQSTISNAQGEEKIVNPKRRATSRLWPGSRTVSPVKRALVEAMPDLGDQLALSLNRMQALQFLRYGKGDFFGRHSDNSDDKAYSLTIRQRRVTALLFLNGQLSHDKVTGFEGGELIVYQRGRKRVIEPRPGLLVAFRSELDHEVSPVKSGQRYSIATWFY